MLDSLPGNAVTHELVIGRAIEASDSFRAIRSEMIRVPVAQLQSRAPLDYRLNLDGTLVDNRNQPLSPFMPNRTDSKSVSLGVSTLFRTGTAASLNLTSGPTTLFFAEAPGVPPRIDLYETAATLELSQSFWRNSFGAGTRAGLEAGEFAAEAAQAGFDASVEQWVIELTGVFHQAWLSQAAARSANERVDVQERLARITRIKAQRGTAEEPHVIQAESNLTQARIAAAEAHEALFVVWRQLVTSLKLPESWLGIDPLNIPIRLDEPLQHAVTACGPSNQLNPAPETTAEAESARKSAEAARLRLAQAESQARPDLRGIFSVRGNSIDTDARLSPTIGETFRLANPAWTTGIALEIPLGFSAEEAQVRTARADYERADANAATAASDLRVNWINTCMELHRLRRNVELQEKTFENQQRRARLEERRFELGRAQLQEVIQAQNDANLSELEWFQSRRQLLGTAWRIWQLTGELQNYLRKLARNPPDVKQPAVETSNRSSRKEGPA